MTEPIVVPPEYGGGGDISRARRNRRAFHFAVVAVFLFSASLFVTEQQYRHPHEENLYRDGLTMHPESGRVMLRNAIKSYESRGESPPIKYLAALAFREEPDLILPTYAKAFELAPEDPELAIRYGAALFREGNYGEARRRFADAAILAPQNALPRYLEAAALAMAGNDLNALLEALASVARVNSSELTVNIPRVLWFADLPRDSAAYTSLMRAVADRTLAPLYELAGKVVTNAPAIAREESVEQALTSLRTLESMGRHLLQSPDKSVPVALAALNFRASALDKQIEILRDQGEAPPEETLTRLERIEQAVAIVNRFEESRDERIIRHQKAITFPLWRSAEAFLVMVAVYVLVLLVNLSFLPRREYWTIAPGRVALTVLGVGAGVMFLFLAGLSLTLQAPPESLDWLGPTKGIWRGLLGALILFCIIYPGFKLPRKPVSEPQRTEQGVQESAENHRTRAWLTLTRRYVGLSMGFVIVVICIWGILFRIANGGWPHHEVLMADGLRDEALAVVQRAIDVAR